MFNHVTYFRNLASTLKEIQHTDENKRFFRIQGITQMNELLSRITEIQGEQLLMLTEIFINGTYRASGSNYVADRPAFTFYIVKRSELQQFDTIQSDLEACRAAARKVAAKMMYDKRQAQLELDNNGLEHLDKSSFRYQDVGPMADYSVGVMVQFNIEQFAEVNYNENDWM